MTPRDEPLTQTVSLGERVDVFKPMMGNIIAGIIISLLLFVGGVAVVAFPLLAAAEANWDLPLNVKKGWSWLAVGMACFLGVALIVMASCLAVYCWRLCSLRVEVYANGFRYCMRASAEEVRWDQVARMVETIAYERIPILKGPAKMLLPRVASTSYTVVTTSNKEYNFDGNSIKSIKRFGKVIREHADRLGLPWTVVETHV